MAKRKVSGIGAIDRQLAATRKKIQAIKRKESEKKRAAAKMRKLHSLKGQLKRLSGRKK